MKLNTLLEDFRSELTLKQTTRFLYVLQDFLIEQYPNFNTKIIANDDPDDLPLAIEWAVGDFIIVIVVSAENNINLNEPGTTRFVIWFTIPGNYCKVTFNKNILFADEISFDIPTTLKHIFELDKTKLTVAEILEKVNDGSLESIKPYLYSRIKSK